jgi:nitrogen fixation protein NifZ
VQPRFEYGAAVRVLRNLRNDGTFPGRPKGGLLVRRGSVGYVRDVGTFLQDQLIYTVHFLDAERVVGCREQELQDALLPWVPSVFETRERVTPLQALALAGEVVARPGDEGEILEVLRDQPGGVQYHVRIAGRTLQIPETALSTMDLEQVSA